MTVTPARWAALDTLRAVRRGDLADRALARTLERVSTRDRPWIQELVFGTFRLRGRLDWLLDRIVKRGVVSLDVDVLDVLRLGAYQLLEMGSVPVYAAVSQSVEMAKRVAGKGAGGLVNGVLHAIGRLEDSLRFPDFARDPVAHLSTWGSHPVWLVERWVRRFGAEGALALVEADNARPELYIRPLRVTLADARRRLEAAGVTAEPVALAPDALRISAPASVVDVLGMVPAVVQDPAAGLVIRYAAAPTGARVVDLCAAPGGKVLELAERAGYVAAADVSYGRMARVKENADRVGGLPLGLLVADARWPAVREADVVLLDVPCTGTGTLRRHPDGKWRLGPTDVAALVELQIEILEAAAPIVRPGGLLVYATCSLEPEENEEQVDTFLDRHPEFAPAPPPDTAVAAELMDGAGRLVVLPQTMGVDGAFAARLRRES